MNTTITAPLGFRASGFHCGVKESGKKDLAIVYCPSGAKAAGVFTTNQIVSASVTVCKKHLSSRTIYAAIVNSGNANACTGKKGLSDAIAICKQTANKLDIDPHEILIASTGIIGEMLPMKKISSGIHKSIPLLSRSQKAGRDFAQAIMTTDTRAKQAVRKTKITGKEITIAGTVKGAGMIGPNMATTIGVFTTDVAISKSLLQKALKSSIGNSLNKLTVDGHQSTNDTAILLTSSLADNRLITKADADFKKFSSAFTDLCDDLAKQMALDAEGATRMFTVVIKNAFTKNQAAKAARAVADYDLVKCAVHGADPNWGRIICAVGSCGVKLNPDKLTCYIGNTCVFRNGQPTNFNSDKISKIISQKEHTITIHLGTGKASDFCHGCDLSRGYVRINADYHT